MSSTHDTRPASTAVTETRVDDEAGSAAAAARVLDAARAARTAATEADIALACATADWAHLHPRPAPCPHGHWVPGTDQLLSLAGPGAPGVSEFAVVEYAAVLGLSTDSGRRYVGDVVELVHRLPLLWARALSGQVPLWQARRVAQSTRALCAEGAAFVDRQVNAVAGKIGPIQLDRLVSEATTRYEVGTAEDAELDAHEGRFVGIDLTARRNGPDAPCSVVDLTGRLDAADARDLDQALNRLASDLAAAGSTESRDVRRSQALGELARHQTAFDLDGTRDAGEDAPTRAPTRAAARQVVLHVHLSAAALGDPGQVHARVEGLPGPVPLDRIAAWCATSSTQVVVKPVIDLDAVHHVDAYEIPDRLREQAVLRDHTCVFPYCHRSARRADIDHITPHEIGGETSTHNLAPLCRQHHRVKTHGGWSYRPLDPVTDPGTYVWTSPRDATYVRTLHGTTTG